MISLMRLLGFPHEHSAGRSYRKMRCSYIFCLDQVLLQSTKSRRSQVSWWQLWSFGLKPSVFRGMENAPCLFTFQKRWEPGGLRNPQTSAQLSGMDPGHHYDVEARWRRQDTAHICFVNSTEVVSATTPPRSTVKITCNQVNFLRNHDGTKSADELLGNAFLFGVNVADM